MRKDLVSIVIVNLNGRDHLQKCLPSLKKQSYKNIEVILVDNASKDGSVEWTKKHFPKVKIIVNSKNLGFAEPNNTGFQASGGEYVLFLNNDTEVRKDFLVNLVKVIKEDKKIAGVQSKILFMDDPKRLDSVGSFLTNTGFLYHYGVFELDSPTFSKEIPIYSAKGACMMFKREVLEKVKVDGEIFDSRYFAYFEETDLCHRIWMAGYKIVYVPTSVIYHKFGATSQKLAKPFVEYHSYKNRINSYIKNLGGLEFVKIFFVHFLLCELLSLIFLFRAKPKIFLAIQKAILWNLKEANTTLRKRFKVQKDIRERKDHDFFSAILINPGLRYYLSQFTGWNITRIGNENNAKR